MILSANNYYDKDQKRFQYFWNWTISPNNPLYFFKLRLLQCGEQLNQLNMTPMEETFLSIITFLSTGIKYIVFFLNQMELFKNPIISAHWSTSSSNLLMWQLYMFKVTRTESWSEISYQIIAVVCHLFTFHMTSPEQHGQFQPNSIKHPKGDANLLK